MHEPNCSRGLVRLLRRRCEFGKSRAHGARLPSLLGRHPRRGADNLDETSRQVVEVSIRADPHVCRLETLTQSYSQRFVPFRQEVLPVRGELVEPSRATDEQPTVNLLAAFTYAGKLLELSGDKPDANIREYSRVNFPRCHSRHSLDF